METAVLLWQFFSGTLGPCSGNWTQDRICNRVHRNKVLVRNKLGGFESGDFKN